MAERKKFLPKDVVVQKGPDRGRIAPIGLAHTIAIDEDDDRSDLTEWNTELIEEQKKELRAEKSEEEIKKADEERREGDEEWLRDQSDLNLQIEVERRAKKAIKKAGLKITKQVEDTLIEAVSDGVIKEHRKQTKKRIKKEAASNLGDNNAG